MKVTLVVAALLLVSADAVAQSCTECPYYPPYVPEVPVYMPPTPMPVSMPNPGASQPTMTAIQSGVINATVQATQPIGYTINQIFNPGKRASKVIDCR